MGSNRFFACGLLFSLTVEENGGEEKQKYGIGEDDGETRENPVGIR